MSRKVALSIGMTLVVMLSATLAGGQIGSDGRNVGPRPGMGVGFLWWGTHEPIYIYGNDGFTVENGVLSGSGTPDDPYIIEGWRIDAPSADYGIYIDHTTAHFIVRDCVVERARIAGVYLNSVRNGRIERVQIGLSDTAVQFLNADRNALRDSVIADCAYGVVMAADSENNVISGNSFLDNGQNGVDLMRANRWCEEGVGNYWSDYVGYDGNGDGIGDIPYFALRDPCPLMAPPVEWTGVTTAGLTHAGNWVAPDGSIVVSSDAPIALQAADVGAGLDEIRYAINGGPWTVYTEPIYLEGDDGRRLISYYGIDHLGNIEDIETISFILDNHPPRTVLEFGEPTYVDERGTWITTHTPILLRRTQESTYGHTTTYFRVDARGWQVYGGPFVLHGKDGPHQITYYSRNASGVAEDLQVAIVHLDDAPPVSRGERLDPGTSRVEVIVGPSDEPADENGPSGMHGDQDGPGIGPVDETDEPAADDPDGAASDLTAPETEEPVETPPVESDEAETQSPSESVDEPEGVQTESESVS